MRIVMIGSGYVGLVSGACLADFGHHITCVDKSAAKIDALEAGEVPIFEPGLDTIIAQNRAAGRLDFSKDLAVPVAAADVVFIAVGTPSRRGDGHADLSYVYAAAREIAASVEGFTVVVTKSTVPVGTGDELERIFREEFPNKDIEVVSNPEFLREGAAITDFKRPDRIVLGTEEPRAIEVMREVYRPLYLNEAPLYFCERRTSELIKYAANAFLAMKITFINEIADLCEQIGADVQKVAKGIGMDKRIGDKFLHAGPGYGGSCFPKDTLALVKTAQDHDSPMRLIETTVAINDNRKRAMGRKVIAACDGNVRGKKIAILGLTFKPNTDDMRDAPSITIIQALLDGGAAVHVYDPEGMDAAKEVLGPVVYGTNPYDIAEGADAVVLVTEWEEFRALDFKRLKALVKEPVLVDLRNIYPVAEISRHGFSYFASDFDVNGHTLTALPTRDCFLPMLATLAQAAENKRPLSVIASAYGLAFAAADRLENFPVETSARLMAHLRASPDNLADFLQPIGQVRSTSDIDGLRVTLADKRIIHFRPSGNAPEMRCYVEAATQDAASSLLASGLARIRAFAGAH